MGLVVTDQDMKQFDAALVDLMKQADAKCALLVDQDGRLITRQGFTKRLDCDALAALLAGSFASTGAIAQLLGENEFTVMFHQGKNDHIHNLLVDDDTILAVIFDDRTTIGMVRLYSKEIAKQLRVLLAESRARAEEAEDEAVGQEPAAASATGLEAAAEAHNRIDDLFGG